MASVWRTPDPVSAVMDSLVGFPTYFIFRYTVDTFSGSKCQKRVRKALLIGGLDGSLTRNDTELVSGLEVWTQINW